MFIARMVAVPLTNVRWTGETIPSCFSSNHFPRGRACKGLDCAECPVSITLQETQATVTAASPAAQPSLWASVREALRGSHQDYTTGSLNRAILLLAIPMVLEMVLESLFAVVDVFWVGKLGADAVATVGLTESLLMLVFAVGIGLSMSTTAMVARRIGERDPEDAAIAGVQAIFLGVLISLTIGIPCFIFAPRLLGLMGASPAVVATGVGICADRVGWMRRGRAALLEQCDLSRRRRCGDCDALAVGFEHHQFDPRSRV